MLIFSEPGGEVLVIVATIAAHHCAVMKRPRLELPFLRGAAVAKNNEPNTTIKHGETSIHELEYLILMLLTQEYSQTLKQIHN